MLPATVAEIDVMALATPLVTVAVEFTPAPLAATLTAATHHRRLLEYFRCTTERLAGLKVHVHGLRIRTAGLNGLRGMRCRVAGGCREAITSQWPNGYVGIVKRRSVDRKRVPVGGIDTNIAKGCQCRLY